METNNCRHYVKKAYEVIRNFRFDGYYETLGRRSYFDYTMDDIMELDEDSFGAGEMTVGGISSTVHSELLKRGGKQVAKTAVGSAVKRVAQQVVGKVAAQSGASFVAGGSTVIGFGVA